MVSHGRRGNKVFKFSLLDAKCRSLRGSLISTSTSKDYVVLFGTVEFVVSTLKNTILEIMRRENDPAVGTLQG